MLKRVIFWLILLLATAFLGKQILHGKGYLLLILPNGTTSIQTSFWLALSFVLLSWLVVMLLTQLISWLHQPFANLKRQLAQKKLLKSSRLTLTGMQNLALGNWKLAKKQLTKAANKHNKLLNLIAASNAAYFEGKLEESSQFLKQAEETRPKNKIVVELSQLRMLLDTQQDEQALASLVRLTKQLPKNKLLIRRLALLRLQLNDYEPLIQQLASLKKQQIFSEAEFTELERNTFKGYFSNLNLIEQPEKMAKANHYWASLSSNLIANEELVLIWLEKLVAAKQLDLAESLLISSINSSWSAKLVNQLGLLPLSPNDKKLVVVAQNWLKKRPNDPELLHCLGRLNQKLKNWQAALDYYLASQKLAPNEILNLEIALLYTALGKHEEANFFNQQAIQTLQKQLPPLPLP